MFAEDEVLSVAEMKNRDRVAAYREKLGSVTVSVPRNFPVHWLVSKLAEKGFAMRGNSVDGYEIFEPAMLLDQAG